MGHRKVFAKNISERLLDAIQNEINGGCKAFTMGTHGEFDNLALYACRRLWNAYNDLEIEVVITSLNTIRKDSEFGPAPYADVQTVMYDIEDTHYKQQITLSNRQMLDACDTLICYVDTTAYKSGAKTALRYAEKRGMKIINLYREEDQPFYGKTHEQAKEFLDNLANKVLGKNNR